MTATPKITLTERFADKYNVDPTKLMATLKATAFKQREGEVTNEQLMALLVVADQYGLNPFTKEIYAFPDKNAGIIPVVGVDGWSRIINTNPQFDGVEFINSENFFIPDGAKPCPEWIECVIYRKDRSKPIKVREYLDEVYRPNTKSYGTTPWQSHPKRMMRHKSFIQCARLAFGFVGIYDQDEAERIIESQEQYESNKQSIKFNGFTRKETPKEISSPVQDDLMQDLSDASFSIPDQEPEFIPVQEQGNNEQQVNISKQDKHFILQLVGFAKNSGSWKTTQDNFKERYSGETLEYAIKKLDNAYNNVVMDA